MADQARSLVFTARLLLHSRRPLQTEHFNSTSSSLHCSTNTMPCSLFLFLTERKQKEQLACLRTHSPLQLLTEKERQRESERERELCVPLSLCVRVFACLCICVCLSVCLSLSACLPVCLPAAHLPACLPACLHVCVCDCLPFSSLISSTQHQSEIRKL